VNETLLSQRLVARAEPALAPPATGLVLGLTHRRVAVVLWSIALTVIAIGGENLARFDRAGPRQRDRARRLVGTIQFAIGAVLLALNARAEPELRWRFHWAALAALLPPFDLNGFFRYSWIIPYGIASVVIGSLCLPFVRALPQGFRLILSGLLFLAAAMGVESIEGYCHTYGMRACRITSVIFEEGGEMIALTIFLVTLFGLLRARQRAVTFELK
jgi:hypothetical protein